ncbi:MAG: hypothetical protein KC933_06790 [Myxococcales bacterium]|nr:hypothetical protein [Myxococcales bacterium]
MYLEADLGWVGCAPACGSHESAIRLEGLRAGAWRAVAIDADAVHRAVRRIKVLPGRFPVALPRVVGDVDAWSARHLALIEVLKASLHKGATLPEDLFPVDGLYVASTQRMHQALLRDRPGLAEALGSLSWHCEGDDKRAQRALRWLGEVGPAFEVMQEGLPGPEWRQLCAVLWTLFEQDGPRKLRPLLDALGDPRLYTLLRDAPAEAKRRAEGPLDPDEPWTEGHPEGLVDFLVGLTGLSAPARRRSLQLLLATWPTEVIEANAEWRRAWRSAVVEARRKEAALGPLLAQRLEIWASTHRDPLHALVRRAQATRVPGQWLQILTRYQAPDHRSLAEVAVRVLPLLPEQTPEGRPVQLWHLDNWSNASRADRDRDPGRGKRRAAATRTALLRSDFRQAWLHIACDDYPSMGWPDPWPDTGEERWLLAWGALCRRVTPRPSASRVLRLALEVVREVEIAAGLVAHLVASGVEQPEAMDAIRFAARLARGDGERFVRVLAGWSRMDGEDEWGVAEALEALAEHFARWGAIEVLVRLDAGSRPLELARWGDLVRACAGLDAPHPVALGAAEAPWTNRYPEPLSTALAELAWAREDAESAAQKILAKDYPDPARLEAEAEALQARLRTDPEPPPGLAKRLDALRSRIARPATVSPARIETLAEKVRVAAAAAAWADWQERMGAFAREQALQQLDLDPQDWPESVERRRTLLALAALPRAERTLARALLAVRRGPRPWDLREEEPNAAFIRRLEASGVKCAPWLDGFGERRIESEAGPLVYRLEDDPLEIFEMGAHFMTCLRPGGMYFFSVVSNAADINKRILYARTPEGQVVGRCLLALGTAGALHVFKAYCHDTRYRFAEHVGAIARELAASMGVRLDAMGSVERLVAPRWHDDGAHDLAGRTELDDAFIYRVRSVPVEGFVGLLEEELGLALGEATIPTVIRLIERAGRPELVAPLWSTIMQVRLPSWIRGSAYRLALDADVLPSHSLGPLERWISVKYGPNSWFWDDYALLWAFVRRHPSAGLRVLARTRLSGVRSWRQERSGERLVIGAHAYAALRRTGKALELLRRAKTVDGLHQTSKEQITERIAELEEA